MKCKIMRKINLEKLTKYGYTIGVKTKYGKKQGGDHVKIKSIYSG